MALSFSHDFMLLLIILFYPNIKAFKKMMEKDWDRYTVNESEGDEEEEEEDEDDDDDQDVSHQHELLVNHHSPHP